MCVCMHMCVYACGCVHKGEDHATQDPVTRFKVGITEHGLSEARTGKDKLLLGSYPRHPHILLKINDAGKCSV